VISVLGAFVDGIKILLDPTTITLIVFGLTVSLIFGIIPGLSGFVSMALCLPFVFRMTPEEGLPFLLSFAVAGITAGSLTAILIGLPGVPVNVATIVDGFPMNQKGEGSRAIGAAITSSVVGGFLGLPLNMVLIPLVIPIVLAFKLPEMCVLLLVGLSFVSILSERSVLKAVVSAALGVLLSTVGYQASTGVARFTFGSDFLYERIGIVPLILGLFGITELAELIIEGRPSIAKELPKGELSEVIRGVKDVWEHKWLCLRSWIIGHLIGLIPGLGGETAIWIAYGQAKHFSKNKEKFGTGCVEGVIAPETANNAVGPGALLTTLAFGIPGNALYAILLGAFLMVGLVPGPTMIRDYLPLCFSLLILMTVGNMIAGFICFFAAPYLVKLSNISINFLFPVILSITFVGAFFDNFNIFNVILLIIFIISGILMKRSGYPRAPLIMGFILGGLFELYLFQSIQIYGWLFFLTPISLILLAILGVMFGFPYLKRAFGH
jgi:putative tricarboxylic transport membrane protein